MLARISNVVSAEELQQVYELIDVAGWKHGRHSAGSHAAHGKSNEEMDQSCDSWIKINNIVANRLYHHPEFQRRCLPTRLSAAFVSRYRTGMAYAPHIDDPVMGTGNALYRADIAITVFLTDPETYSGGELNITTQFGNTPVKLNAGSAVAYPASSLHEVTQITSGVRIAAILWAQSMVRDPHKREILADLDDARQALHTATPNAQVTTTVDRSYSNLIRLWAEP